MKFFLKDTIQQKEAQDYLASLIAKEANVEIIHKHGSKTLNQNNYLYLIMSACSLAVGSSLEWFKLNVLKQHIAKDIFAKEFTSKLTGKVYHDYRSIATLDADEIRIVIDRLIRFASTELQIEVPDCDDYNGVNRLSNHVEQNRNFL